MRPTLLVSAALAVGLTLAGLTLAAGQKDTYKLTSTLKAGSEVPKPTGTRVGAKGTFTGRPWSSRTTARGSRGS